MLNLAKAVAANAKRMSNDDVHFFGFQNAYTSTKDATELVQVIHKELGLHCFGS